MKKSLLLLVISILIFAGCKKKQSDITDPDHIQQEIWYIYDSDNLDSYFGIRFYDLDWYSRVILYPPSSITLNGNPMNFNPANSVYESIYVNEQVQEGTFVYKDAWNRVYTNTAKLQRTIELPVVDTLYKNRDNVIEWSGAPCGGSSDVITIHVGILIPVAKVSTSVAGATSITVRGSDLALYNSEMPLRVYIERTTIAALQQGTQGGGKITTKYESKTRWVIIK